MLNGLIVGLILLTIGNLIYLHRMVAKLGNELSHIKGSLEHLQNFMDSLGR